MNQRSSTTQRLEVVAQLLGTLPDLEVARKVGVSASAVGRFRRARGIPAYDGYKFGVREVAPDAPRRRSRLEPYRQLLGKVPDQEVATLAGVTPEGVRIYRKRKGIPMEARAELSEPRRASPRVPSTAKATASKPKEGSQLQGFVAEIEQGGDPREVVLVAQDMVHAALQCQVALSANGGRLLGLRHVGPAL